MISKRGVLVCVTALLVATPSTALATGHTPAPLPPNSEGFTTDTNDADDSLYADLSREVENARLVRLLTKLNFINERPEFEHDRQWAENGERFFLKLFRDYVFHQVDAQGHPVIDLAHVLTCMNKLDAGIDERITLISRDEQNVLVVSYRELKRGVESAFQDLINAAVAFPCNEAMRPRSSRAHQGALILTHD